MAAVNLPDNPANGTTSTVNGITYTYNSSKGYWTAAASSGGGGGGGASVSTSDAAPGSPSDGDLWYDTDDGGMFVYYQDSDSSQWVEVIGSQGAPGPAGAAGASTAGVASVYATVNALPTTGNTQGDMAHVTANNTLYFWNGSGWYKIALINTNPSISGVASTYSLALDGTATTVTITATDPEGLPIIYSIASDTSGNIATVSQGTGASTNVFTITPSTNTAYAGSFTLTFRASDGVNIATAPATFTLQFQTTNSRYTSSLFTSVGANNAVNNSFDDKSTNDHTITTVGDATQTTFSPYRDGGYSAKMDGGDRYTLASSADWNLGSSWTIEGWFKPTATPTELCRLFMFGTNTQYNSFSVGLDSSMNWTGGGAFPNGGMFNGVSATLNEWQHVAWVRDGSANTATIYLNGVAGTAYSNPAVQGAGNTDLKIGYDTVGTVAYQYRGNLADVRITKSVVYSSNFTPPERFTASNALTDTKLLAFHTPYLKDESGNNHSFSITGDPKIVAEGYYDRQEYSAGSHGGSASFDGTGDYLHMPQTSLDLGSDDFCVEAWVYTTSTANQAIVGSYRYADGVGSWNLNVNYNSNKVRFFIRHSSGTVLDGQFESGTFPINQWVHVAVTRDGANLRAFINGTQAGSTNTSLGSSSIDNAITTYRVGAANDNAIHWNGNITDVRVVKGSSVYTSNFTPTTTPLTAITNTIFLLQNTDAGIIDKAQTSQDLRLFGNTKSSTTQNKFLTSSMYFDGSGDYLKWTNTEAVDFGIGGEAFTLEWWQWWPSIVDSRSVGPQTGGTTAGWNGTSGHQWTMFTYSSSASLFMQWWNGSSRTDYELNHGGALTASTWQHFAVVYDGTNLSNYIDGTRIGHRTSGNTFGTVTNRFAVLGGNTAGTGQSEIYYSDVRITKGLARYSGTSLTVPTEALQG